MAIWKEPSPAKNAPSSPEPSAVQARTEPMPASSAGAPGPSEPVRARESRAMESVIAADLTIEGKIEGNIESASRVELLESGMINGDVKAGSLTVAAGSRMRGQAEFGWNERDAARTPRMRLETGSTA